MSTRKRKQLTPTEEADAKEYFGTEVLADRLPEDTRWQRGKSGNLKGRPKEPEGLTDMLMWRLGRTGSKQIADVLIGLAKRGNLQAIQYIYDRIEGKPRQSVLQQGAEEPEIVKLLRQLADDTSALEGHDIPARLPAASNESFAIIEAEVREVSR